MKTIKITVSSEDYLDAAIEEAVQEVSDHIIELLKSSDFISYVTENIRVALNQIASEQVSTINDETLDGIGVEKNNYLNSMKFEVKDNVMTFYNDSVINISDKKLKPTTSARYPLKLSLASIIEYGIGYTGQISSNQDADNWEYDVRGHGYKGWYYVDSAGNLHWTNGLAGRYIFLKLKTWIEENISDIIDKYLSENL